MNKGILTAQPSSSSASQPPSVQEFTIRAPKNMKKTHHVMRYNANLNVDFQSWKNVKLERENNMKEFKGMEDDMPKFGAGSEFNRDLREEARRKKYGIISKKYKPELQPWILKVGGKPAKKFRGVREGGVSEHSSFYVFTHAPDGAIEAYPLNEWYNFQPIQRYKALSAEEAEVEFGRRKKVLNYFSLMLKKRLKGEDDDPEDKEEAKNKKSSGGGKKELKISEMEEWMDSDENDSSSGDDDEKEKEKNDSDKEQKAKDKKKKIVNDKKKKRDVDVEAFEDSDDGDEEGRERDYISDSSESDSEPESKPNKELKSVAEEGGLRKLLTSDEDSDNSKKEDEEKDNEEKEKDKEKEKTKEGKEKEKKKKKLVKKEVKKSEKNNDGSSSVFSSDSSDSEAATSKKKKDISNTNSRSASPIDGASSSGPNKRKATTSLPTDLTSTTASENSNSPTATPAKKPKTELGLPSLPTFAGAINTKDDYGITEEAVRRYLMRKPMTTTELLTKFKNKKTGVSSEKLVETMTNILKKINPVKQHILGKMHLSIKVVK